jgi:hypothetical protein
MFHQQNRREQQTDAVAHTTSTMARRACLLLPLLAACVVQAAAGLTLDAITQQLVPPAGQLDEANHPVCVNTLLSCSATCRELSLKAALHRPIVRNTEALSVAWQFAVALMAGVAFVAWQKAFNAEQKLADVTAAFQAREAELQLQLQGVKEQAYDLGRRAARRSSRANSTAGGITSRPGSRASGGPSSLRSPMSSRGGAGPQVSAC